MTEDVFTIIMRDDELAPLEAQTEHLKFDEDVADPVEERLRSLCLQILSMRQQIQKRIWSIIKIPIAPATLFAGVIAVLAQKRIVPDWFAFSCYGLDITLATLKSLVVLLDRSETLHELQKRHAEISDILESSDSADILRYQAILDAHGVYPYEGLPQQDDAVRVIGQMIPLRAEDL